MYYCTCTPLDTPMYDKHLSLELLLPKAPMKKPFKPPTALTMTDMDADGLFFLFVKTVSASSNMQRWSSTFFGLTMICRLS